MAEASLAQSRAQQRNVFADRLIRDIIVQVSIVVGLGLLIWFFTSNYLSQEGSTNWAFLTEASKVGQPAPITLPVDKQSTVASVYAFGLLNTMIVAVVGIVLATVLGFMFGVMRLSSNILLSRIAQVYIEVLRNIPLAVQLLFLNVLLLSLPGIANEAPHSFLGGLFHNLSFDFPSLRFGNGDGTGTWLGLIPFEGHLFPTQWACDAEGECGTAWLFVLFLVVAYVVLVAAVFFYLMPRLNDWAEANKINGRMVNRRRKSLAGFIMAGVFTLLILLFFSVETTFPPLVGWSMLAIFFIALFWANAVRAAINNWADDRLDATGKRPNVGLLAWLVFLAIVLFIFVLFGGPVSIESFIFNSLTGRTFFGFSLPVAMIALIGALAIYTSAFIAEIVRAGIQSVNNGQREAAASLGLRPGRIMNLVIIPQALKVIVPPLNSQYMNLAKNSSLAFILKYPDLVNVLNTTRNNTGRELEVALMFLLSYLAISLTISVAMNYVNARVQVVER